MHTGYVQAGHVHGSTSLAQNTGTTCLNDDTHVADHLFKEIDADGNGCVRVCVCLCARVCVRFVYSRHECVLMVL
jgi:hypothetical protein